MTQLHRLANDQSVETRVPTGSGAGETFFVLAAAVERFVHAWEQPGEPPGIDAALPLSGQVRRLTLIELVKVDLEYRWKTDCDPRPLADYVRRFPELGDPGVPADLIYEEFHHRQQAGLMIDPQEYLDAYPEQAERLRAWFDVHDQYRSTKLVDPGLSESLDGVQAGGRLHEFDLILELGRGAFARVFLARQSSMQRLVAVKVSADTGDEAKTLAHLDHDYIVRVHSVYSLPEQGLRLLLMQYVPGGTLQSAVERSRRLPLENRTGRVVCDTVDAALESRGDIRPVDSPTRKELAALSWPETVAWVGQRLATALEAAHANGVLHRDVKPANVLLTADGAPKLADFNTSFSDQVSGSTPAAWFGGSLAYMSPEQLEACSAAHSRKPEDLDGRTDLYSLGILLWEMLTGTRPLSAELVAGGWQSNVAALIDRRRSGLTEVDLATIPPNCPEALRRVLIRCLEPEPERRWPGGQSLARQLELCLDPHARSLTDPPARSWIHKVRNWLPLVVVLVNILPNAIAAVGNYQYNHRRIIELLEAEAEDKFQMIQTTINGTAFPLAIALMAWMAWRVRIALRQGRCGQPASLQQRLECLRLGERCAGVCLILWIIAGVAYPLSMHALETTLSAQAYGHFFVSLFISGLIATAYPYLLTSSLVVHACYPATIAGGEAEGRDRQELQRLERGTGLALFFAGAVPLLAVAGLSIVPGQAQGETFSASDLWLMRGLCLGGALGLGLAWKIAQRVRQDLAALLRFVPT